MKKLILTTILLFISFEFAQAQEGANTGNSIALVDTNYSCEAVEKIKFDAAEYTKLSFNEQVTVDAKWRACRPVKKADNPDDNEIPLVIINPAATSEDNKVFYGLIKQKQLTEARKACTTAGNITGVTLMVGGTATGNPMATEIGSAVFEYTNVSCASLEKEFSQGNLIALLGPNNIIGHAVANKLTQDTIKLIPLVSDADKKKLGKFVDKVLTPPSVSTEGSNITITAPGGVKGSIKKPCVRAFRTKKCL